jgi:hypothetical protein
MENKNLRSDLLNTEFNEDLEFNIEEVEQVIAPQVDGGLDVSDTTGDTTDDTIDDTPDDGETKDGGGIKAGTLSLSRRFFCC